MKKSIKIEASTCGQGCMIYVLPIFQLKAKKAA